MSARNIGNYVGGYAPAPKWHKPHRPPKPKKPPYIPERGDLVEVNCEPPLQGTVLQVGGGLATITWDELTKEGEVGKSCRFGFKELKKITRLSKADLTDGTRRFIKTNDCKNTCESTYNPIEQEEWK